MRSVQWAAGVAVIVLTGCSGTRTGAAEGVVSPTPPRATAKLLTPLAPRVSGALNSDVTQASIGTTICSPGWTKTVRPSGSFTTPIKRRLLSSQELPGYLADYELDHLVSLALGGAPRDLANLWMQPYEHKGARFAPDGRGSESKDTVESTLNRDVCAGRLTLAEAQRRIAADWRTALAGL